MQPQLGPLWGFLLLLPLWLVLVQCDTSSPQRTLHRLVGGHMRTQPELDDAELIITSSAGGGRESKTKEGDDKKTLSQQVADGKYGLIQNELFSKPVKKPGIISYESNPEVPKDNINNLGGLNKNDIWLAENHLLVIRGGDFADQDVPAVSDSHPVWPPIDDYHAPGRQVKLPSNPKVPPPFPVQLTEDGPLQILGTNYSTTLNGTIAASPYPLPPAEGGFYPSFPSDGGAYQANTTSGETPFPIPAFPPEFGTPPFPLNGSIPPFFASLPPGAAILPPPSNTSIEYDDDDPSIYYPPPYSFYYQMDNSTQVPPGPLVPGIVLPPPPNFFAPLDKPRMKPIRVSTTTTTTTTTTRKPFTTVSTEGFKQIRPTTTALPPTPHKSNRVKVDNHYIPPPPPQQPPRVVIHVEDTTPAQPIEPQRIVTIVPVKHYHTQQYNRTGVVVRPKPESVTVLKPVKTGNTPAPTPRPIYFYENNVKPYKIYGPPSRPRTTVSSTQIPLKAQYHYSTSNEIDTNSVVTQLPETDYYRPRTTTKQPRQYYYYEEQPQVNSITTQRTPKQQQHQQNYFNVPQEYYVPAKQAVRENYQAKPILAQQPQYYYRPSRPPASRYRFVETTKKPDSFSIHVARLKQQIHQYYTTPEPYLSYEQPRQQQQPAPKPVYQFSFQAANYQPQQINGFRASPLDDSDDEKFQPINKYNVEIQPAIEVLPTRIPYQNTPSPGQYYHPKPIQVLQTSTERPSKYYTTPQPDYDYEQIDVKQKSPYQTATATPKPISQYSFDATPNPYQQYYTKPEDAYLDDLTQKYFTVFGKKIPGQTTPIPTNTQRPNVQIQYAQSAGKEVSLHGDTIVNYVRPRPIEAQAEYVRARRPQPQHPAPSKPEIVQAIPVKIAASPEGKPGSFISYELPGDDGAHFYFLTPQLAQSRDQGAGFYFENPKAQELKDKQQQQQQRTKS